MAVYDCGLSSIGSTQLQYPYQMPRIEDLIDKLEKAEFLTKIHVYMYKYLTKGN